MINQNVFDNKGFTLLELLVVISIIGILLAVGATAFTTAQKRGRDARREADIKALQNAFEQYYAVNGTYNASCDSMAADHMTQGAMPSDPKSGQSYICNSASDSYCVCATLENTGAGNANDPSNTTCTYVAGGNNYCLSNLQ